MGGKGGDGGPEQVTHIQRNVPEWVEKESPRLYQRARETVEGTPGKAAVPGRAAVYNRKGQLIQPAVAAQAAVPGTAPKGPEQRIYQGPRVAPMHALQQQGMKAAGETYGKYEPEANEVANMIRQQYAQGPQNVTTNRFTGTAPNTLFQAYHEKMYQPAAEELNRQAQKAQTMHERQNLFGNKRMASNYALGQKGLEESRLNQLQNLGANIFNQAMQTFQTEEGRALEAARANQAAGLQNKQLNLQAANNMMNNVLSKYNMNAQDLARLMTFGQTGQAHNQKEIDATMQKFNEMNNYDRMELEWLAKFLAQNPGGTTSSTSSQQGGGMSTGELFGMSALPLISNVFK